MDFPNFWDCSVNIVYWNTVEPMFSASTIGKYHSRDQATLMIKNYREQVVQLLYDIYRSSQRLKQDFRYEASWRHLKLNFCTCWMEGNWSSVFGIMEKYGNLKMHLICYIDVPWEEKPMASLLHGNESWRDWQVRLSSVQHTVYNQISGNLNLQPRDNISNQEISFCCQEIIDSQEKLDDY